jgi:hypothetical protein
VSDGDSPSDAQRPLEVALEDRLERRIRLYADRLNRRLAPPDAPQLVAVDDDRDLAEVVMLLCEIALEFDERQAGLAADLRSGELRSRELADEHARRRRARRTLPRRHT